MTDQDHLRDDPTLPLAQGERHPLDRPIVIDESTREQRRTPLLRPLMMTDAESWDFDLD